MAGLKRMGEGTMGRYRSPKKDGGIKNAEENLQVDQKKVSKMRTTCKSHTNDKVAKASAVRRKRAARCPGGKPTNVATFAKKKKYGIRR